MKLWTTLVTTLLALSLWAGSNQPAASNKGRDSKANSQHHDSKPKEKPRQDQDRDSHHDRDHGKGNDRDDHHAPRDCNDDRHDHGHGHPKPPKPPKDPVGVPAVPTGLTAEAVSLFQINLSWTDKSTNELGFKIERSLDGKNFTQIAQVLPNTTVYRDLNRFPGMRYFYRARAFNVKGDSAHSIMASTQTRAADCELSIFSWGSSAPTQSTIADIASVAAGGSFSIALKRDGTISSWQNGQTSALLPSPTGGLTNLVAIAAGSAHGLALRANGSVVAWGDASAGQLDTPPHLSNVVAIAAGGIHSLALRADGTVVGWGENSYQQTTIPAGLTGVVAIAAGYETSLALRSDGTVVAWGAPISDFSINPATLTNVVAVSATDYLGLALHADGHISSWTYFGQPEPTPPPLLTNVLTITAGSYWSTALLKDGTVVNWGAINTWPSMPPATISGVVAISGFATEKLALTTAPALSQQVITQVLATNRVLLSWSPPSALPQLIELQRTTNAIGLPVDAIQWTTLATIAGNATNYTDVTTVTNQSYWYRFMARNACETSISDLAAFATITPPQSEPAFWARTFADKAIISFYSLSGGTTSLTIERARDPDGMIEPWQVLATIPADQLLSSYTNSGLALHETYWYRARAHNGLGDSRYSIPVTVTIVPPAAPGWLTARIGATNQIFLTWQSSPPEDQEGFKIERATDIDGIAVNWTEIGQTTNSGSPSFTDANDSQSGSFWYRVRSFNFLGDSTYSAPVSITLTAPPPPLLSGQNFGTMAYVNWFADYPGDVVYHLERTRGDYDALEAWEEIAQGTNVFNGTQISGSYNDSHLLAGESYRYRIRLSNWLGASAYSNPVKVTIQPPNPPSLNWVRVGGSNYVTLGWSMANVGTPARIKIERAADNNSTPGVWNEIASLTNLPLSRWLPWRPDASYNDSNVVAGATYWYRLRSQDAAGLSDYSNPLRFRVEPPPQLWQISGIPFSDEARLVFHYPSTLSHVDGMRIERADNQNGVPGNWSSIATIPLRYPYIWGGSQTYYTNKVLAAGTYWYRVAPFNWAGTATFSQAIPVTIKPPEAGTLLTARIGNTQQVLLTWFRPLVNDHVGVEIEHAPDADGTPGAWKFLAREYGTNQFSLWGYYPQYAVTNVPAQTTNWYRLRVFNAVGYSDYLGPVEARTVAPPPTPTNVTAQFLSAYISLSWYSTFNSEYGYISQFEIERAADQGGVPGPWQPLTIVPGGEWSNFYYTDNDLTGATKYWYRLRASNWLGVSPYSTPAGSDIFQPPAPKVDTARIGYSNQVILNLSVNYATASQRGFKVERAPEIDGNPGAWTEIGSVFAPTGTTASFTDTNAAAYTTNWYRTRIFNPVGVSEPSQPRRVSVTPPPAPSFYFSTFANRATLNLANDYSSYGHVAGFKISRTPDDAGSFSNVSRLVTMANPFAFTDVLPAIPGFYVYRIQAYNWIGDSESTVQSIPILPPNPPNSVAATVGTSNRVKVSWYSQFPADQEGFKVERAPDMNGQPGNWIELAAFRDTETYLHAYVDTNAIAGTTNWYRVRSFTVIGDSLPSNPASVRLTPPPVPGITATPFANHVNLAWDGDYYSYGVIAEFELERAADIAGAPGIWAKLATFSGTTRNHVDTGLPPEARVWYRIRARNWLGDSGYSHPVNVTITSPAGPVEAAAQIGNTNEVTLHFESFYPYEQDGFEIERAPEIGDLPGTWESLGRLGATNQYRASFTDSNALALTTNWYRARTFNAAGISTNSMPVRIAVVPPPPVLFFTATAFADQAQLRWLGYNSEYGRIQGHQIERATDVQGQPDGWTRIADLSAGVPWDMFPVPTPLIFSSFVESNLTANATYWYRIRAYNWVGAGDFSLPVRVEIVPPRPPSSLTTKIGMTNSVELEWDPSIPHDAVGFLVERAFDLNNAPAEWSPIATVTNLPSNWPWSLRQFYTDANVSNNIAALWYRVRAFNQVGISIATTPVKMLLNPPPPPELFPISRFRGEVSLSWNAHVYSAYGAVFGFKVERADDVGNGPIAWQEIGSTSAAGFVDTGLRAGKYWYRVKAYNWIGSGAATPARSVTIFPPSAPQYLDASVGTTNQVELRWQSASPNDQHGFQLELAADAGGIPGTWEWLATIYATNAYTASYVQSNVIAFSTNWYRILAFSPAGISDFSPPLKFVVGPPPTPTLYQPTQFADQLELTFNTYTMGNISSFDVERALDIGGVPGTWIALTTTTATNSYSGWWYSGHTDAGLALHDAYWYRVRASNWVGKSDASSAVFAKINSPVAPSLVTARIGNTNQVKLTWFPPAYDIAGYHVERATDVAGAPGDWAAIATVLKTNAFPEFTDTNVIGQAAYWYRVRSFNTLGVSSNSPATGIAVMPPPAPTAFNGSALGDQARFSWLSSTETYGLISGFKLDRAPDNGGTPGAWEEIQNIPTQPEIYWNFYNTTDSNLTTTVTYWYRIRAYNWLGAGVPSFTQSITIKPPGAPVGLITYLSGSQSISLFWSAAAPQDQHAFALERSTAPQTGWTQIAVISATNYSHVYFDDFNFIRNTTNYYRVRAFNVVGHSSYSSIASAMISSPAAALLHSLQIASLVATNQDMLLTWTGLAGTTNVVEAAAHPAEMFAPISPKLRLEGDGNVTTNFLDVGALTNSAARFYRIREVR